MRHLLEPLSRRDARALRGWLAEQGVDVAGVRDLPDWSAHRSAAVAPDPATLLSQQFPLAARTPAGLPLLLLYLHHEVAEAWEKSYQYIPMWQTLGAAGTCLDPVPDQLDPTERPAVAAALALLRNLDHRIRQENALTSGVLPTLAAAAHQAAAEAEGALRHARTLGPKWEDFAGYLTAVAGAAETYDRAVATAALALAGFWATGAPLTAGIDALRHAESRLGAARRREANELQAHRFSLQALQGQAEQPWLRVDSGTVTYIYPFHLSGIAPQDAVAASSPPPDSAEDGDFTLAGAAPVEWSGSLDLDDIWNGSDWLGRRYAGAVIGLPDVTVRAEDGSLLAELTAQVRLSTLGNHYVRFEGRLDAAGPAEVSAALLRAAPEHGIVEVRFDSDAAAAGFARLSDCATAIAEDLGTRLAAGVSARPGMFHVVVVVHNASLVTGPGRSGAATEARTLADVAAAAGSQVLTNAVTHCVGSLAEWARYDRGTAWPTVPGLGLPGTAVISTRNTTVLVEPGSPEFSAATRATVAEFVATLDGLFTGWQRELSQALARIRDHQLRGQRPRRRRDAATSAVRRIEQEQTQVQLLTIEMRSIIGLVSSPTLVASPTVAALLETLLRAADFPRRVAELERNVAEVVDGWLLLRERDARRRLEVQERRQRARMDTLLAIIAAVGLSGLGQIIQSGFEITGWGAVGITMVIVSLIAAVGLTIWRVTGRDLAEPLAERPR